MKCRVCRGPAVIDVPRHNANFCAEHFVELCRRQVAKAVEAHAMLRSGDRILVAVSGGKDSLAVWDLLRSLGHEADGFCIDLGIGDYSAASSAYARRYAKRHGLVLHEIDLRADHGFDVPTAAASTRRAPCSACGLTKRHLFDRTAIELGYDVVVTGHNLDDEAAVLFGNTLRWDVEYLARQLPVLEAGHGFPRKVKPLVRLAERETAAYCVVRGIDYQIDECPMAGGNRHLGYKAALHAVEQQSPGTKAAFYLGFLERMAPLLAGTSAADRGALARCRTCGAPTTGEVCSFCWLRETAVGHDPVPVELVRQPRRRR